MTDTLKYSPLILRPDSCEVPEVAETVEPLFDLDSIFASTNACRDVCRPSLFENHSLQATGGDFVERFASGTADWIFLCLLAIATLLSIFLNQRHLRVVDLFVAMFSQRRLDRIIRESGMRRAGSVFAATFIYLLEVGMLTMYCLGRLSIVLPHRAPVVNYLLLSCGLIVFVMLRNGLTQLLGSTYDCSDSTALYVTNNCVYQMMAGMLLMPLLFLLFYGSNGLQLPMVKVSLIIIGVFFVLRIIRGVYIILTNSIHRYLYLFYYLCILETVPILIIYKAFIS